MLGSQLGSFQIVAPLGRGGMGEVWKATDLRLGREVAVKVLPAPLIADPDLLARFQREARLLASLAHPRIAALFDLGEDDGRHFLVMELVEGETLSDRLERGPLPPDEALHVAGQIAEAVAAAHAQGVIHRDLKPGNVMLTEEGDVKVLDFGLAKATAPDALSSSGPDLSASPTLSLRATEAGMILGTAAYMSPEQARGQSVDARTDVWSWACVLFEMLTGRKTFDGDTVADIIATILQTEPPWDALPTDLPPTVEPVLRMCLARDPKQRLGDLSDARLFLQQPIRGDARPSVESESRTSPFRRIREVAAWAVAAALGVLLLTGRGGRDSVESPIEPATRLTVSLRDDLLARIDQPALAISPDGRVISYTAEDPETGDFAIRIRHLDRPSPESVPGIGKDATSPFFSPDGTRLGFFADGRLMQVALAGGTPIALAETPQPRGAVWRGDDTIVYSPFFAGGIWTVPAEGGEARELVAPDPEAGERTFRWPALWPDGRSILFTVGSTGSPNDYTEASVQLWHAETGKRTVLVENAQAATVLSPDLLVFVRDGALHGVRLDVDERRTSGSSVLLLDAVLGDESSGATQFALSPTGTLLWAAGDYRAARGVDSRLMLVDREGRTEPVDLEPRNFAHPTFSPDGETVAFTLASAFRGARGDVWTFSLEHGSLSRLTFEERGVSPTWSPDGTEIAFNNAEGTILAKKADGSGSPWTIPASGVTGVDLPASWSSDGETLALTVLGPTGPEIWIAREGESRRFETDASLPVFSPDGKWLAYNQPASGETRVYVRPVEGEGKWQISPDRGSYPRWPAQGGVILYLDTEGNTSGARRPLLEVDVSTEGGRVRTGPPRVVLETTRGFVTATSPLRNFDVSPDGSRFVFVESLKGTDSNRSLEIALGWGANVNRTLD